jgi:hypothetical protein
MGKTAIVTFGVLAIALGAPTSTDSVRWWRSSRVNEAVRLSPAQVAVIDGIYRDSMGASTACAGDAAAARRALDELLVSATHEAEVENAAARLAERESACRRLRTFMLYQMYCELSVPQRRALAVLARERGRSAARPRP